MASKWAKSVMFASMLGGAPAIPIPSSMDVQKACYSKTGPTPECAEALSAAIVGHSEQCFYAAASESKYDVCCHRFCTEQCTDNKACSNLCYEKSSNLYVKLQHAEQQLAALKKPATPQQSPATKTPAVAPKTVVAAKVEAPPVTHAMDSIDPTYPAEPVTKVASVGKPDIQMKRVAPVTGAAAEVHGSPKKAYPLPRDGMETLDPVAPEDLAAKKPAAPRTIEMHPKHMSFMSKGAEVKKTVAPEDELAKEMTHDLEMNFNKIAPFGKEDTAKELQDHAAKTQDTLVDAVENAEVAEIKRAVFRALTRLRAATIKEFDTIARLETQAIDAYNDAHHYRAENPLTHLHEDEAPVETDKLKSFH